MLKAFRDNLKYLSWVLWLVIAAFILVEFVIFGNSSATGGSSADAAVTVGDETVSYREFESAYRRMEDVYRNAYGDQFNSDFARQLGLHRQVIDALVADRILLLEAERLGLKVTNDELQSEILRLPVFQAEGGGFIGADDYERILRQNGYSPDAFEATMRQDLLIDKARNLVGGEVYVADAEVEAEYRKQVERATVRFLSAPYSALASAPVLEDEAVEAYYAERQDAFETPERREAEYLVVDIEQVRNSLTLSTEELRAYYEDNRDQFEKPEQLRARHILLQVKDDRSPEEARRLLEEAKQRVARGEDFAALAAELSEDPGSKQRGGDLGFFGRGAMVEQFEAAAFGTPVGQMVGPVETDFGFHLIQVLERNEGGLEPFEQVEASIRQRLLVERGNQTAEERADALSRQLATSDVELAALAETDDSVTYQTTPAFAADDSLPSIGRATPFAAAAFELEVGEISEPVRIARGWALVRLTDIQQPRIPELDEVRPEVESELRAELLRNAALERLTEERDQGLDALAAEVGVEVEETESLGANDPLGSLGAQREILAAVLEADEGAVLGPFETDGGGVLVEVVERVRLDPVEFEQQKAAMRENLVRQRAGQLVAALIGKRRAELDISFDPQLLASFESDQSSPAG